MTSVALGVLGLAIIALTIVTTAIAYPGLPDRAPLHLGLTGKVDSYGPKPAIWLMVGVQIFSAATLAYSYWATSTHQPGSHGSTHGLPAFGVCILAILWRGQLMLIDAAKSPVGQTDPRGFWIFFIAMMALGTASLFLMR